MLIFIIGVLAINNIQVVSQTLSKVKRINEYVSLTL